MFTIQPKPTFKVDVTIPTTNGPGTLKVEFAHKGRKAMMKFLDEVTAEGNALKDIDALMDVMVGWSGADRPFSREALEDLLDNYPGAGKALFDVYMPAVLEGRAKN